MIVNKIKFPEFTGLKCNMMPFIQGDASSLPKEYQPYAKIINDNFLEKGKIGLLTIDESFVKLNTSQRGFNYTGTGRNVHIEVGINNNVNMWGSGGGSSWGGHGNTFLNDNTQILIANNIDNTCKVWDVIEKTETKNGDLTHIIDKYPENTGILLKAGELAKISIFTPHECIIQLKESFRQFIRIVGEGVTGRESYFTVNPILNQ